MLKLLRASRQFISDDGAKAKIDYFTTEKKVDFELEGIKTIYGIEIVKSYIKDNVILFDEFEGVDALTGSAETLNYILGKLVAELVTPVDFLYVIDDLLDTKEPFIV